MLAGAPLAALHVVMKARLRETKVLENAILSVSICWEEASEIFYSSLFKRDTRNVTSLAERMLVGVPVAALHVVL